MVSVMVEIPAEIWKQGQEHYKVLKPSTQFRMDLHRMLFVEGLFEQRVAWANGKMPPPKPAAQQSDVFGPDDPEMDDEVARLLKAAKEDPAPRPAPSRASTVSPLPSYWSNDRKLKEDMATAISEFIRTCHEFITPEYTTLDKTPEQVEDFLEDIDGLEWDELASDSSRGYLAMIRQAHRNWWKATYK